MYKRILIVVNDRTEAQTALNQGLQLAKALSAEVSLLCVTPRLDLGMVAEMGGIPIGVNEDPERELRAQAEALLAKARMQADQAGVRSETHVDVGDAVDCITRYAREHACDLIVAGTDQHNAVMRLLTGSAIPGLITRAPVPVLVCHPQTDAPMGAANST